MQRSNRESCLLGGTLEFVVLLLDSLLSRKALQCLKLLHITGRSYWSVLVNSRSLTQSSLLASDQPKWQVPVLCKGKVSRMFLYVL